MVRYLSKAPPVNMAANTEVNGKLLNMNTDVTQGRFPGRASADFPEDEQFVRDPVCMSSFQVKNAFGKVRHGKVIYHFCSPGCEAPFIESPQNFLMDVESHSENLEAQGPNRE